MACGASPWADERSGEQGHGAWGVGRGGRRNRRHLHVGLVGPRQRAAHLLEGLDGALELGVARLQLLHQHLRRVRRGGRAQAREEWVGERAGVGWPPGTGTRGRTSLRSRSSAASRRASDSCPARPLVRATSFATSRFFASCASCARFCATSASTAAAWEGEGARGEVAARTGGARWGVP